MKMTNHTVKLDKNATQDLILVEAFRKSVVLSPSGRGKLQNLLANIRADARTYRQLASKVPGSKDSAFYADIASQLEERVG
jgi:hypothetical protein